MEGKNKSINFGAGPGKIPTEVLKEAKEEFLSYDNIEYSVTELSHRSDVYGKINQDAQNDLRELLSVPDNYKILFLQGGGQGMFAAIAMNLIGKTGSADYAISGIWSQIAAKEAEKYGTINSVFPKPENPGQIPDQKTWKINPNASYFYYCANETIEGIEFPFIPETNGVPIVADMFSNIITKAFDVSKFGVILAAAQKNLGTAGVAIIIIREDLLGSAIPMCPSILNFSLIAQSNSIYNTPPVFSIYILGKVLKWIKKNGGLAKMESECEKKSKALYDAVKNSNGFYSNNVCEKFKSRINVPIRIKGGDIHLENKFLAEAEKNDMYQLKGHKLLGGIRVSMYNAISYENVNTLIQFMKKFQEENI